MENNYLYAFEAERKAELDILIQTETDPEKRKAYEAERAAIIKRDIDRQQAIEASCQRFNKGSAGCASQIAEANRAKASYSASTDLIHGVGMQRDKRRYSELFSSDFARVNEALQGKDPVTVQKEAFAIEVSKAKNTRPEDEYTWISNGIDLGWLGEYQGWGRSIKGLPKSGNFATKVPKEVNANGRLSVVEENSNYFTNHASINGKNVWSSTKKLSSKENLDLHWEKHKGEFPELNNVEEYSKSAHDLIKKPPLDILIKYRNNGDKLLYSPSSNIFISINKDGTPKTMFKPDAGINYWEKQR